MHHISFQALKLNDSSFIPTSQVRASVKFLFMTVETYQVHCWGIHQGYNVQTNFVKSFCSFKNENGHREILHGDLNIIGSFLFEEES